MDTQTTLTPQQSGTPPSNKSKDFLIGTIIALVLAIPGMAICLVDGFNQKIMAGIFGIVMLLIAIVLGFMCIKSPIGSERKFGIIIVSVGSVVFIVALIITLITIFTPEKTYHVYFDFTGSGQITATIDGGIPIQSGAEVAEGKKVTFKAIPAVNATVKSWTINDKNVQPMADNQQEVTVTAEQHMHVEFTDAVIYGIILSDSSWDFAYGDPAKELRIDNVGISPTGPLSVELHDDTRNAFEIILPNGSIYDMPVGKDEYFSVRPKVGLPVGKYTAKIVVSGDHKLYAGCQVTVIVGSGHGQ